MNEEQTSLTHEEWNIFSCHRLMIAFANIWFKLLVDITIDLSTSPDTLCSTAPPLSK
jgi:hypothetical protein